MNDKTKDLIELGAIAGAHGIKGQVLIKPFGDDPASLTDYGPLTDESGQKLFTIKKIRPNNKGMYVATVKEITDRNQAEASKSTLLFIDRNKLPQINDDEFYYSDLIGLDAKLENGDIFGKVINVVDFGAGDLIELMPQNDQKSMYLSFTNENVPSIHIKDGHIVISLPEEIEVKEEQDPGEEQNTEQDQEPD